MTLPCLNLVDLALLSLQLPEESAYSLSVQVSALNFVDLTVSERSSLFLLQYGDSALSFCSCVCTKLCGSGRE